MVERWTFLVDEVQPPRCQRGSSFITLDGMDTPTVHSTRPPTLQQPPPARVDSLVFVFQKNLERIPGSIGFDDQDRLRFQLKLSQEDPLNGRMKILERIPKMFQKDP